MVGEILATLLSYNLGCFCNVILLVLIAYFVYFGHAEGLGYNVYNCSSSHQNKKITFKN